MANYLVQYTLCPSAYNSDMVERVRLFLEMNGEGKKEAKKFMKEIVDKDGDEKDYFLYTINMCKIVYSSELY